jgi:hypothetical protein
MKIIKYGDGASSRPHESYVIKNSETIFVGGTVFLKSGSLEPADAVTDVVYGICVGFVGADGNTPYENLLSGQKGSGDVFTKGVSLAVHSDNETVAKIRAKVVPLMPNDIVRGVADRDLGTVTGALSSKIGNYININTANESQFKENTATSDKEQFLMVGFPGGDQPRGIDAKVVEGQIFGQ